jgi:hypothetical protein
MKMIALTLVAALMLMGCVTRSNWNTRIGVYTCNQAIMDYGRPISQTSLNDGSTVAEWMTELGNGLITPGPYVYSPSSTRREAMVITERARA